MTEFEWVYIALTDKQIATLLDTIKDLPPYLFVMLGLYAGLRREEIYLIGKISDETEEIVELIRMLPADKQAILLHLIEAYLKCIE